MFNLEYRVGIGDINYGGHMGNERALLLFQDARIAWLKSIGLSEMSIGDGAGIIQREASIRYHSEVFLGDKLRIEIDHISSRKSSMDIYYKIFREDSLVIEGNTVLVAFNYARKKPVKIPEILASFLV